LIWEWVSLLELMPMPILWQKAFADEKKPKPAGRLYAN
jgi:hypothetical protein|tara:strand:+ start:851 stop:964 length:114 start_codon:yes stop_codon:yes gene_type:complete